MWREIPGVMQVDEKGHKWNTAVVTPYLCGGNMVKETAEQEEILLNAIVHFEHYYKVNKKRQLCDRGFRRNWSLQAVWDTPIARSTGFM